MPCSVRQLATQDKSHIKGLEIGEKLLWKYEETGNLGFYQWLDFLVCKSLFLVVNRDCKVQILHIYIFIFIRLIFKKVSRFVLK